MKSTTRTPIRYAVIGLGYISQIGVLPAFAHARATLRGKALVSGDPQKLKAMLVGDYRREQFVSPWSRRWRDTATTKLGGYFTPQLQIKPHESEVRAGKGLTV